MKKSILFSRPCKRQTPFLPLPSVLSKSWIQAPQDFCQGAVELEPTCSTWARTSPPRATQAMCLHPSSPKHTKLKTKPHWKSLLDIWLQQGASTYTRNLSVWPSVPEWETGSPSAVCQQTLGQHHKHQWEEFPAALSAPMWWRTWKHKCVRETGIEQG